MLRQKILTAFLVVFVFNVSFASIKPEYLTCEYTINPLGIDIPKPRFAWNFNSAERNQFQSAYEIIVSDKLKDIQSSTGNTWQTGKVMSSSNIQIEYAGNALKSFTRYYWRVRVYDATGAASDWSEIAWFETAMLDQNDWTAKWIGDGSKQFEKDEDFYQDDPMPLFRKSFKPSKKIASARLYISGLGYYEAYLNEKKIGDHVLDPGFTTYKKQAQYVTYDITNSLSKGSNTIGIMLGNGWYNPLPIKLFSRFNLRDHQQTGRPCVKAQILIQYTDRSSETIVTDESWQAASGPVIRNNVYLGEKYDARQEKTFNSSNGWKQASIASGPDGILTAQMQPPIRVTEIVKPVSIREVGKDTFIVDLGQNFAGVARIKVKGKAGDMIGLRYGEDTLAGGRLNYFTTVAGQIKEIWHVNGGAGSPKTAWQRDEYTLKGAAEEKWSPRFTFHGFRYVEITGWPGKPTLADIEGLRMNTDLKTVGNFECSNQLFTQLHKVIQWTFLSNVFSVQSDCPGREKMGYGADIVVTSEAFIYNYDMSNFYRKTVRDFNNEQQPDGGITEIAPYTGIADRGYGGESGPLGWQLGFPFVQKRLYDYYGDKRVLKENYDAIVKQMNFLQSKAIDGLFHWDISDHEALDPKPEAFSAAAFYYHHAVLASEIAGILDKNEDSTRYGKLASRIKENIVGKYLVPKTGRFDNSTQSAQIFALYYNFSPEKDSTFKVLLSEYARHNWHLSTGIFSTKMMFDYLRENDQNELAYAIANQKDFPGWIHMLKNGATTLWETWAYPDNAPSQNHPMFGSVDEWFYKSLLGINAGGPGFEKIIIKPQPVRDLQWAKGNYKSVRGNIAVDWRKQQGDFNLQVTVPVNTETEIWIPAKSESVFEGGKQLNTIGDIKILRRENGYTVVKAGSGNYSFTSKD